jgi:hypothetical protein
LRRIGLSKLSLFALSSLVLVLRPIAPSQTPTITQSVSVDQKTLVTSCAYALDPNCRIYPLKRVLDAGGHFWTTPCQPYSATAKTDGTHGDGYGEGPTGIRHIQRAYLNANNPNYRFLRMNGLDSQSCYECHNSVGSYEVDRHGAMIRKPVPVGGSAGSNSNAFINPLYSRGVETLFIRNPPAVFGAGYTQQVAMEMTDALKAERETARMIAKQQWMQGKMVQMQLSAKGISFGTFKTTYLPGTPAFVQADPNLCNVDNSANPPTGALTPVKIGGVAGFKDDVTSVDGVSCDLVVRPFQWKGIASSLRHFVRDALEFHFSMQAFEKVGECDCDQDGKGGPVADPEAVTVDDKGPEIKIGQITSMAAFVAMMRPPVEARLSPAAKRGRAFFFGADGKSNCASCHVGSFELTKKEVKIEWPINPLDMNYGAIDPAAPATWAITPDECKLEKPDTPTFCPGEFIAGKPLPIEHLANKTLRITLSRDDAAMFARNPGSLVQPLVASTQLAVVRREEYNHVHFAGPMNETMTSGARTAQAQGIETSGAPVSPSTLFSDSQMASMIEMLETPLTPASASFVPGKPMPLAAVASGSVVGTDYVIPLNPPHASLVLTPLQLPRLKESKDGKLFVPLMSDLKRHNMGPCLADPSFADVTAVYSQGTDVMHIMTSPTEYLTRPLWGVADTGPWLHDGRAMTLQEAILMHGDSTSCPGSDANAVIDKFEQLSTSDQDDVIQFLLTLRLPPPGNEGPDEVHLEDSNP